MAYAADLSEHFNALVEHFFASASVTVKIYLSYEGTVINLEDVQGSIQKIQSATLGVKALLGIEQFYDDN